MNNKDRTTRMRSHCRSCAIGFAVVLLAAGTAGAESRSYAERLAAGAFDEFLSGEIEPQRLAAWNTFVGRPDLNTAFTDIPKASNDCPTADAEVLNGAEWVLASAADARVVMFNENHYGTEARAFVRQLLDDLRGIGFTHIGFEAFSPVVERHGRPYTPAEGTYTVEPVFAALVRDAKALGYEVFGYEATIRAPDDAPMQERVEVREQGQADNLAERIDAAGAEAKFIVYAGWSHIAEEPISSWGKPLPWMAARFKQATGIDPLTIDLTSCVYPAADPGGWRGRLYIAEDGRPAVSGRYAGAVDAQVRLPVPAAGDPEAAGFFRSSLGDPVPVPASLRLDDAPVLVQAYRVDQQEGEVAYDRILLRPQDELPLYLPSGTYRLVSHRGNGEVVGRANVDVN
ncbi:MAG TPA: hypothetical protein VFG91_04370 [Woeseiaceae bacterium]|nr:hypothetical protein [Woeseiaceae bacterium]